MSLAVATRYANALVDVVLASKGAIAVENVKENLNALADATEHSSDFRGVMLSPAISAAKKKAVMEKISSRLGMHELVRNFVLIVVRNRRTNLFPQIRNAFERQMDQRMGVVKADVLSATALEPAAQASLEGQLARLTGKRVRCLYKLDPGILGGVVARIGSTVYDGSVRGQLELLRRKMSAGA